MENLFNGSQNTTGVAFEQFGLEIKLIDADGVIIENVCDYVQNWKPGEKVKFEFSTDKEFDKIEWTWEYYN